MQEPHICTYAVLAPLMIFALDNGFDILATLKYYFIIFKHCKLSNTAFLYLVLNFATGKYPMNAFVLYF